MKEICVSIVTVCIIGAGNSAFFYLGKLYERDRFRTMITEQLSRPIDTNALFMELFNRPEVRTNIIYLQTTH